MLPESVRFHGSANRSPEASPDTWKVLFRNDAGVREIKHVLSRDENCGELPRIGFAEPEFGTEVRLRVSAYEGPESMSGLLVCIRNDYGMVTFGAKLVKIVPVNIGIIELVFQSRDCPYGNSPTVGLPL